MNEQALPATRVPKGTHAMSFSSILQSFGNFLYIHMFTAVILCAHMEMHHFSQLHDVTILKKYLIKKYACHRKKGDKEKMPLREQQRKWVCLHVSVRCHSLKIKPAVLPKRKTAKNIARKYWT